MANNSNLLSHPNSVLRYAKAPNTDSLGNSRGDRLDIREHRRVVPPTSEQKGTKSQRIMLDQVPPADSSVPSGRLVPNDETRLPQQPFTGLDRWSAKTVSLLSSY